MKCLIDGDILVYRVGYTTNDKPAGIASYRFREMLEGILNATSCTSYQIYLSDHTDNCFRKGLYPEYKSNRTQSKPTHYEFLKEYAITYWNAKICPELEADDALGINQDKEGNTTVIASIDKDLLQIPGSHYNFLKKEFSNLDIKSAERNFYTQTLVGDTVDNIVGCPQIGAVKAERALGQLDGKESLYKAVVQTYFKQYAKYYPEKQKEEIIEYILLVGRLLRVMQREDEGLWCPPELGLEVVDSLWESRSSV